MTHWKPLDEIAFGRSGYNRTVRAQLLSISAATIDRYLKAKRDRLTLKGIATTKPGALLRNSITVRKAGEDVADEPGFFDTDTVVHCGPTLKGGIRPHADDDRCAHRVGVPGGATQ